MLARVTTFAIDGVSPRQVWVEVDIRSGLPTFTIVGLGDTAVRESRDRIRAAIFNSGFKFPDGRITANLAPASLRKAGPGFDAAIALALLAAAEQVPRDALHRYAVFGELSLGGELRDSPGALAVAEGARHAGCARLIVPTPAGARGRARPGAGDRRRRQPARGGGGPGRRPAAARCPARRRENRRPRGDADLADVRGQEAALLAVQVAAAGGHNLLMEGAPGTGKTMLARRVPSILPPLDRAEAIEVTRIHSVAGLHANGLIEDRPFRAPHHTISASGLAGGGSPPRPGEASLAHNGILFLDELSEFQRPALDALRQPLEDGSVTIVRGQRSLQFPTRFMLVAATNPCPCGFAGVDDRCTCGELDLRRHRRRMSGPLLDRMDLMVDVRRPTDAELRAAPRSSSADVRARVVRARERQARRLEGTGARCNAEMDVRTVRTLARLDARGRGGARPRLCRRAAERPRTPPGGAGGAHGRRPGRSRTRPPPGRAAGAELPAAIGRRGRRPVMSWLEFIDDEGEAVGRRACDDCLRRTWLLAVLAGYLDRVRDRIDELLPLDDVELITAVTGRQREMVLMDYERFSVQDRRLHCADLGIDPVCRCDPAYPQRLLALPAPPAVLHLIGGVDRLAELLAEPVVAVVGARRPSPYGRSVAHSLGRSIGAAGLTVVSGMALGIDSAAHRGALDARASDDRRPARQRRSPVSGGLPVAAPADPGARAARLGIRARLRSAPLDVHRAQPHHRGVERDDCRGPGAGALGRRW